MENARALATYQYQLATVRKSIDNLEHCFDELAALLSDGRIDEVEAELQECQTIGEDLESEFVEAEEAFENIDDDLLEQEEELRYGTTESELRKMGDGIGVIDKLIKGLDEMTAGFGSYLQGGEAIEREEWGSAIEPFDDARVSFSEAEDTFSTLRQDPDIPAHLWDEVTETRCRISHMEYAAKHLYKGSIEADAGNMDEAEQMFTEAARAQNMRVC